MEAGAVHMNKRLYNQIVTVYTPYRKPSPSTELTLVRAVILNCHWEENSILVFRMTGTTQTANIEVNFPRFNDPGVPEQITPEEWHNLPADINILQGYYSFALPGTGSPYAFWTQPRIFRGVMDYVFDWGTQTTINAALTPLTNQGLKLLKDINYNWFGDRKLHHVIVR